MVDKTGHHEPPDAHPGQRKSWLSHNLNRLAEFLSTAVGFLTTFVVLVIGIALGWMMQFNDAFMFGFNLFLSMLAIVISGIILVAGSRSEAALHVKLDYLIRYSKAKNDAIGLEHKEVSEIEAERKAIEKEAKEELDDVIEEAVEEEVAEQLDERTRAKEKT